MCRVLAFRYLPMSKESTFCGHSIGLHNVYIIQCLCRTQKKNKHTCSFYFAHFEVKFQPWATSIRENATNLILGISFYTRYKRHMYVCNVHIVQAYIRIVQYTQTTCIHKEARIVTFKEDSQKGYTNACRLCSEYFLKANYTCIPLTTIRNSNDKLYQIFLTSMYLAFYRIIFQTCLRFICVYVLFRFFYFHRCSPLLCFTYPSCNT